MNKYSQSNPKHPNFENDKRLVRLATTGKVPEFAEQKQANADETSIRLCRVVGQSVAAS